MITDPWSAYAQLQHWEERISRLEERLQSSLVTASVDHALAAIPFAAQGLLADARRAMWELDQEPEAWSARLQAYADQIAEDPGPQDPPLRAVEALVYAFADKAGVKFDVLEALYSAYWSLAETVCPSGGWIEELLGRPDLEVELEARTGACQPAYRELGYQAAVLERLERDPTPLVHQEAARLADQTPPDETAYTEFARMLFRRAQETLYQAPGAARSYIRVLLYFAAFEQEHGQFEQAAFLYHQALAELQPIGSKEAIAALQARLKGLK